MYVNSPVGVLAIHFSGSAVCELRFIDRPLARCAPETAFMRQFKAQLQAYFSSADSIFTIPLLLRGSAFQQRVWTALQQIPAGEVRTYGQLAKQLHSSARAVGNACRHNPAPIVVPCHRVVSAQGLGGFCGRTDGPEVRRKHWLLKHEGIELPLPDVA